MHHSAILPNIPRTGGLAVLQRPRNTLPLLVTHTDDARAARAVAA